MSDRLGEALAVPARPVTEKGLEGLYALPLDVIDARTVAARNWHALTNPTDELVGRVVPLIRELTEMARRSATDPDWLGSLDATVWTLAILDALAVTADEEATP